MSENGTGGPSPWDLLRERLATASLVDRSGSVAGEAIAGRAEEIARGLRAAGVRAGQAVEIVLPQDLDFACALLGCWAAGAVPVPVDARLPAREVARVAGHAGAAFAIATSDPGLPWATPGALADGRRGLAAGPAARDTASRPAGEALLLVTSGTTGPSKLASVTARSLRLVRDRFPLGPDQTFLAALPLAHAFGLFVALLAPLARGARVAICEWGGPADAIAFGSAHRATVMPLVPRMLAQVLRAELPDLGTVRAIVVGGAAAPEEDLVAVQERYGVLVGYGYGMTETSAVTTLNLHVDEKPGSVGRPFPGVEIRIAGAGGAPLGAGEAGEVWLRDGALVAGYAGDGGLPVEGGWLRTGDLGYLDDEGYLYLTGRAKEIVITSGYNVSPVEVERVLTEYPGVEDAAVYGRSHPEVGEEVVAVVVARAGVDPEAIRAFARERLAGYKVPREILVTDEDLPRTPTGKVAKWRLAGATA